MVDSYVNGARRTGAGPRGAGPRASLGPVRAAVRTEGLTKDYGSGRGVFDLDLEVHEGEILGFLGPNGAGKSTTMRMLLGLARPTAGRAEVLGRDVLAARTRVGYLAGDFELYDQLDGAAVLAYFARLRGDIPQRRIDELAERFGADLVRPVRELSTGNRQKIGLIQAFMGEPELLILDEPIAGLDPLVQRRFHDLLAEIRAEGRTVLLSSHTLSEVDRVADRVAVLRAGRLAVVDTLEHLRAIAVRRWEIEFANTPPDPERFRRLPGVLSAEANGDHVTVAFEGDADAVVKAAAESDVRELRVRDDDLEQVFLRLYEGGAP
jgi:ABC-2 type transport system ATP-binding protein